LICETAAYLASSQGSEPQKTHFLKLHSFDLGYYCNVPDLIWKRPGTYKQEAINHYMNLESYQQKFGDALWAKTKSPMTLSRADFDGKNRSFGQKKGRSWWRIQELEKALGQATESLKKPKQTKKQRHSNQILWLTLSGVIGHYIGDLAMPLHLSENYDGVLTGQKGIHHYFEETMVDELYLQKDFGLQEKVFQEALKQWPKFLKRVRALNTLDILRELSKNSNAAAKNLLKIDKTTGRKSLQKALESNKELVVQRLVKGSLYQAYIFQKYLGWNYSGDQFYDFNEAPKFIKYPGVE